MRKIKKESRVWERKEKFSEQFLAVKYFRFSLKVVPNQHLNWEVAMKVFVVLALVNKFITNPLSPPKSIEITIITRNTATSFRSTFTSPSLRFFLRSS